VGLLVLLDLLGLVGQPSLSPKKFRQLLLRQMGLLGRAERSAQAIFRRSWDRRS
jgi:hypothetical protein